ncbi:hypothetical protein AAFF_G00031530 [Aldrovandia affinis]|uniref:Uncharacterized protein n=1 Tax=Aldrovandia affinis TaxID=143900 RepID=A0AAD7S3S4_9TELE|nr:hypothetical protein AAFF_G00031530 [Aldrovandia affinis]
MLMGASEATANIWGSPPRQVKRVAASRPGPALGEGDGEPRALRQARESKRAPEGAHHSRQPNRPRANDCFHTENHAALCRRASTTSEGDFAHHQSPISLRIASHLGQGCRRRNRKRNIEEDARNAPTQGCAGLDVVMKFLLGLRESILQHVPQLPP